MSRSGAASIYGNRTDAGTLSVLPVGTDHPIDFPGVERVIVAAEPEGSVATLRDMAGTERWFNSEWQLWLKMPRMRIEGHMDWPAGC